MQQAHKPFQIERFCSTLPSCLVKSPGIHGRYALCELSELFLEHSVPLTIHFEISIEISKLDLRNCLQHMLHGRIFTSVCSLL